MSVYLRLFWEFFQTGLFAVGGGMATLPFLKNIGQATGWYTYTDLMNMLAVSESTPGPIGINMATYVGYTTAGIPGALAATIGIIIPGIVLVLIITAILDKFRNNVYVEGAFYGLRPASVGLITAAGILVVEISLMNTALYQQTGSIADLFQWKAIVLAALLLVLTRWVKKTKGLHPVYFIVFSAVVGIVFHFAGV